MGIPPTGVRLRPDSFWKRRNAAGSVDVGDEQGRELAVPIFVDDHGDADLAPYPPAQRGAPPAGWVTTTSDRKVSRDLATGRIDATSVSIGVWLSMPDKSAIQAMVDQANFYKLAPLMISDIDLGV